MKTILEKWRYECANSGTDPFTVPGSRRQAAADWTGRLASLCLCINHTERASAKFIPPVRFVPLQA
jgi:hypothetical protein